MASAPVRLERVPETLLWTLYHRAVEARRPDAVLSDPLALELVAQIDYPFEERFGSGEGLSQWQAVRARTFDTEVTRFLTRHPQGTVVALGEGLETQSWRVDNGTMRWISVDLPEVIELRRRLLPRDERRRLIAASVLDPAWVESVGRPHHVLFTAQGVLMYLAPDDVHSLFQLLARRFPGAALLFDAIPRWLLERSRAGKLTSPSGYAPPPWSWALAAGEEQAIRHVPNVASLRAVHMCRGRGIVYGMLLPAVERLPGLRRLLLSVWLATFGEQG